jgi:hypothetical protein
MEKALHGSSDADFVLPFQYRREGLFNIYFSNLSSMDKRAGLMKSC